MKALLSVLLCGFLCASIVIGLRGFRNLPQAIAVDSARENQRLKLQSEIVEEQEALDRATSALGHQNSKPIGGSVEDLRADYNSTDHLISEVRHHQYRVARLKSELAAL